MRKTAWQMLLLLGIILIVVVLFDTQNSQVQSNAVRSMRLAPTPAQPVATAPFCDYTDVTQVITQRLGLSMGSFNITDMKKTDSRYISILLFNANLNRDELYLYDLGADGQWNTQDDRGFFIDETLNMPSLMTSSNGVRTLFWISYSDIKRCTLTPQGCVNIQTLTTFTNILELNLVPSSSQNRMYIAYVDPQFNLLFVSCSLQQGTPDSCSNPPTSFTSHQTLFFPPQMSVVQSLLETGFIYIQGNAITQGHLFNINLPIPGTVLLPSTIQHIQSIYSLANLLVAIQTTTVAAGQLSELVLIDQQTGMITAVIDTIDPINPISPLIIDTSNSSLVTLYYQQNNIMGKRPSMPAVSLYVYSQNDNPIPKVILPDGSVLGMMGNRPSTQFIRFDCIP
ncbi:MAG: hypothetical protein Q8L34_01885 [Candidatus Woesearchaeota archaeon]|nr:hypothetical protein [Candidatus Woesearchaeota archaeon]